MLCLPRIVSLLETEGQVGHSSLNAAARVKHRGATAVSLAVKQPETGRRCISAIERFHSIIAGGSASATICKVRLVSVGPVYARDRQTVLLRPNGPAGRSDFQQRCLIKSLVCASLEE